MSKVLLKTKYVFIIVFEHQCRCFHDIIYTCLYIYLQVYKNKLYDRRYQWLHFGLLWGVLQELKENDHPDGCTRDQLVTASEGWISVLGKGITPEQYANEPGGSGLVSYILVFFRCRDMSYFFVSGQSPLFRKFYIRITIAII